MIFLLKKSWLLLIALAIISLSNYTSCPPKADHMLESYQGSFGMNFNAAFAKLHTIEDLEERKETSLGLSAGMRNRINHLIEQYKKIGANKKLSTR
jgi:hypothetical protein